MIPPGAYPVEANPSANIVQYLDLCEANKVVPDLALIRSWALTGVIYMRQIEGYSPKQWGDVYRENCP